MRDVRLMMSEIDVKSTTCHIFDVINLTSLIIHLLPRGSVVNLKKMVSCAGLAATWTPIAVARRDWAWSRHLLA